MLCKMAFWLSNKVVALHLDNSTAKSMWYSFLFLSRSACCILNLAKKHGISLIPACIPISVWKLTISPGASWFLSGTCLPTLLNLHLTFEVNQRWICWHPHVPINISVITPTLPLEAFGLNAFNHPLSLSGKLCVSFSSFSSPGSIHVPGRMCHRSVQTFCSCGTLLDGGSLASHISKHVGRHSL